MKEIILTIVTVTYNCEKFLQRTLDSVYNQDYDSYEYLIIDGRSTDKTVSIIEENITKFNGRLRYISEPDRGVYDAMNKGIRAAKGKYVGIINGDDYYNNFIFKKVISMFEEKNADIIYSDLIYTDNNYVDSNKPLMANHHKLIHRMSVNHPTCFVKREIYDKYGLFDLNFRITADYEIMVRFFMKGCKFHKSSQVLAVMEYGGLSSNNWITINEKYRIHKKYYGKVHALKYKVLNILIFIYRKTKWRYKVRNGN
ncbi:PGL/p-HBAD biosynthesis glycosyltransferase [Oxobacter pfennigii]|uniref:PGL/p-HBAD biosynthesis glycosyltransferase n=1 Tax=Oxobacter pfennigii TaxID=36849 RepID=A0A0N8NT33_9CLOT|nr:glycosyltransferase family 2 protein [Oxobacter pfennigii]KPU43712.1 PGL/p-HBAD biosynthesis glycosyltransferase [Oxobacter pfennigii]